MKTREGQSQEEYCSDCFYYWEGGCNVNLKDGEVCGDKDFVSPEEISTLKVIDYLTNPRE